MVSHGNLTQAVFAIMAVPGSRTACWPSTPAASRPSTGDRVIAVTHQVPVVPVAIQGTGGIWPPGRRAIRPGQARPVAGRPLQTTGLTHHDVDRLRDQAWDVICSAHRSLVTAM